MNRKLLRQCAGLGIAVIPVVVALFAFPLSATALPLLVQLEEPEFGQLLGQVVNPGFVLLCDGAVNSDATGCTPREAVSDVLVFEPLFGPAGAQINTNMLFCSNFLNEPADPGDSSIAGCTLIRGTPTFFAIPETTHADDVTIYMPTATQPGGGGTNNTYRLISDHFVVPEPGALLLLATGLAGLAVSRYRRSRIR
jgi:PEP-CTERM motif